MTRIALIRRSKMPFIRGISEIRGCSLLTAVPLCDQPQAATVFRKERTPTRTGKRQRMGLGRLAVTSTRFGVALHRDRCIAACWQDDFRLRHSAKNSRTCPRKAVGMSRGAWDEAFDRT